MSPPQTQRLKIRIRDKRPPDVGSLLSLEVYARREAISNFIREFRVWQRPLTAFCERFLRPGDVAVDVGAHIGYFATVFANAVGAEGAVYAFEPDPDNFVILERNKALNRFGQMSCQPLAVSDRAATMPLYRSLSNMWGSSLHSKSMHSTHVTVEAAPLDQLLEVEQGPIRLIKIDVEGAELDVLRGMTELLARHATPPAIIMEFAPDQIEAADPGLGFILGFAARHGFDIRLFIGHEGPSVVPPRVEAETLLRLHKDFLKFGEAAELDLLLITPEVLRQWAG